MFCYLTAPVGKTEIFSSASRGDFVVFPVSLYVALVLKSLERAVKSWLLQRVLPVRLFIYFVYNLVSVLVLIIEGSENYSIDVAAYQIGADGGFTPRYAFKFFGIFIHRYFSRNQQEEQSVPFLLY